MKKLLTVVGAGLVMYALALSYTPQAADAQASVSNKPDGQACFAFLPPNAYFGPATWVISDSGQESFTCNASLVFGPGVSKATHWSGVPGPGSTTCKAVETPSGNANANCKN